MIQQENKKVDTLVETQEPEYWQWIKGDLIGDVVTFKDTDDSYINFNEGGRIAIGLKDEFLQSLDSDIAGEFITTPSKNDPLNSSIEPSVIYAQKPGLAISKSPIRILFDKQKKNNKIKLILEILINIPQYDMHELMTTSFGEEEVNTELTDFILDQVSTADITECLNQSIKSLIESKYKSE
jgi:hypothetical protein